MNARNDNTQQLLTRESLLTSERGMSLVEILIVITLMAVVGTVAATNVIERMHQGYRDTARTQIGVFKGALEEYARFCNRYPTTDQGLEALVAKPTSGPECNNYPAGGIMKDGKIPKDPWGKDYIYSSEDGKTFLITSYARDGKEGGDKGTSDEDVRSDNL